VYADSMVVANMDRETFGTSVCGLTLLVYAALGLRLLVYADFSY
jgi:hypothetical protein